MIPSHLQFSFFLIVLLFSFALFYLYFKNQYDRKFGYAGLFFIFGAGFLLSSYMMENNPNSPSVIFWNKFMFFCIFANFFVFPHFVFNTFGRKYDKSFSLITLTVAVALSVVVLFTDLLVTHNLTNFAGVSRPIKTPLLYLFTGLLTIFVGYIFFDAVVSAKRTIGKLLDVKPMIAGICLAIILGVIDITGTFFSRTLIMQIRDPTVFGILIVMLTFAWSFLSQYTMAFASLSKSKKEIEQLIEKSNKNFMEFVQLIAKTLDAKDEYTAGHSLRVADYAVRIARELNLPENEIEILKQACLLHDIGKIGIPDGILNKKGPLNDEEMRYIVSHPILGKKILGTVSEFKPIIDIVYSHHERVDGKGYPEGLDRDRIPLLARIIAVADTYDAMISERPYRRAKSHKMAIEELKAVKDKQLDGEIVDIFLKILERTAQS
uniref:HD-GYP domain-containing protein n=1 Tax=candidate division WOR-3 bacterium TaxID=2052148 RepID=A0A7C4TFP3_UNCW3